MAPHEAVGHGVAAGLARSVGAGARLADHRAVRISGATRAVIVGGGGSAGEAAGALANHLPGRVIGADLAAESDGHPVVLELLVIGNPAARIAGVRGAQRVGLRGAVAADRAIGIVDIAIVLVVHRDQIAIAIIAVMLGAVAGVGKNEMRELMG